MSAAPDSKLRQKQPTVGIAAGAEDAKYHAKYKELKRKVKDFETDNDKLHFQVLQARLTVRRMKMERAILYEKLSTAPPSPNIQDRHPLPPMAVMQGAPAGPPHSHLRLQPGGPQSQHRGDYPFHPDLDQQRIAGGPNPHIHPDNIRLHHHHHHPHSRMGGGDPRILNPAIDPRSDSRTAASSPVHSPPTRLPPTHDGNIPRQPPHNIPTAYDLRAGGVSHDSHHAHTSPPISSHHNSHVGTSHSRKRSHSHSSPRMSHLHQIEPHQSGHIHSAQTYRVLSSGSIPNNPPSSHGPGSGTATPAGPLGPPPHQQQYPEHLAPLQQPLHSPPLSELEFERGGRPAHHSHSHLHPQHPHSHAHNTTAGGGHQHHPQLSHHHHVVHHHHQPNHPHSQAQTLPQTQAQAQNEYGGGLPLVGDPPSSASPAIQSHGPGYENSSGRGTASAGPPPPPGSSSASSVAAGSTSGSGRTHVHSNPRDRVPYDYTTQPDVKRERERERDRDATRDRERERDRDHDREWERERDRAREYSRGELINYSPPHHRTRSSQSQNPSHSSVGRAQNLGTNPSGEFEQHSTSSRSRASGGGGGVLPPPPSAHAPQTQTQYQPSASEDHPQAQAHGYRDYPPPPPQDPNVYPPRLGPSSRAPTPNVPGSGSVSGNASTDSGARDRDPAGDRGRQQHLTGPPVSVPSLAAAAGGGGPGNNDNRSESRSRDEMEME